MSGLLASSTFRLDRMAASADTPTSVATDLAEHLVRAGVPFRDAHAIVGALVRRSLDEGIALRDLVAAEPSLGADALPLLERGASVRNRTSPGGAGPDPVAAQLVAFTDRLAVDRARWSE